MDCTRNELTIKKELRNYFKQLGIEFHSNTKALGHQGFCRANRIDISKNTPDSRIIPVMLHEFAHYILFSLNSTPKSQNLEPIFGENSEALHSELLLVTNFVDENSTFKKLITQKETIKENIKYHENIIKQKYPSFKRSQEFKPFSRFSRFSDIKYLLKHDAVKVLSWFTFKTYSIMNLEKDFENVPQEFVSYLKLRSFMRKQKTITNKINKMQKYYNEPSELFSRFVEGLYINKDHIKEIAPNCYKKFFENIDNIPNLKQALIIAEVV